MKLFKYLFFYKTHNWGNMDHPVIPNAVFLTPGRQSSQQAVKQQLTTANDLLVSFIIEIKIADHLNADFLIHKLSNEWIG